MGHKTSVTHSFDQNQRFNELTVVSRVAGGLNLRSPTDGNVCPPGHYMLFLLNDKGLPSEARIIQVTKSTLVSVATGADNLPRVLWQDGNGKASIWNCNPDGSRADFREHGPFPGWGPSVVAAGGDNLAHLRHVRGCCLMRSFTNPFLSPKYFSQHCRRSRILPNES